MTRTEQKALQAKHRLDKLVNALVVARDALPGDDNDTLAQRLGASTLFSAISAALEAAHDATLAVDFGFCPDCDALTFFAITPDEMAARREAAPQHGGGAH